MNNRIFLMTSIIGVLAATGIVLLHGSPYGKTETNRPGKQKPPPRVRVMTVKPTKIAETLELTGTVEPYRIARLASPAEGPVATLHVREADRVQAGEALLSIGRKKGVEALIIALREELKKEEDNLNRTRQLVEGEALAGEQLDQARAAYQKARALLIKAEETAQDFTVKAPWTGVISRVNVKEGEFVAPRAILVEMYDPARLVICASIPEKHAARAFAGMRVEVRLDAYQNRVIQGRITRAYPYLDARLRTRTVEIELDEEVDLLPGMFARLEIVLKGVEKALTVPIEALISTPEGPMVFVLENGKAGARKVETGIEAANRIEIVKGIQPGERVIVAGNDKLKDGIEVRPEAGGKEQTGKNNNLTESPLGQSGKAGGASQ